MSNSCESIPGENMLLPCLTPRSRVVPERQWESAPTNLPTKRSLAACAFLLGYVAVYVGVGFAGATLLEHTWSAIFR